MSAMQEEVDQVLTHMHVLQTETIGQRTYHRGILEEHEIVLVFSRWGKVAAAATSTTLIIHFAVTHILFVGVAGGIAQHVSVGDIVLGESLYQHDLDASPLFKPLEIPLSGIRAIPTDPQLNAYLLHACQNFQTQFKQQVEATVLNELALSTPEVHQGIIASGDRFISSRSDREHLIQLIPDLLCVEMEGAAVGQVCYEHGIPFSVVRIISDAADEQAPANFRVFLEHVASRYSFSILTYVLQALPHNDTEA